MERRTFLRYGLGLVLGLGIAPTDKVKDLCVVEYFDSFGNGSGRTPVVGVPQKISYGSDNLVVISSFPEDNWIRTIKYNSVTGEVEAEYNSEKDIQNPPTNAELSRAAKSIAGCKETISNIGNQFNRFFPGSE